MRFYKEFYFAQKEFGIKWAYELALKPRLLCKFKHLPYAGARTIVMRSFLNHFFHNEIEALRNNQTASFSNVLTKTDPIWVCWWQGVNSMPAVIVECFKSLKRNANGHPIIVIDKNNYHKYADIPTYIIEKVQKNIISFTHFSDILRCALLSQHGGFWIDAAIFVTSPINIDGLPFFSPKINIATTYVSGFKWVPGCIAAPKNNLLFIFAYNTLLLYWKNFNHLVDYLLIDFILETAYENNSLIKKLINSRKYNNEQIHQSRYLFNEKNDEKIFQYFIHNNQFLSLTWRFPYKRTTKNGEETFYGRLLREFCPTTNK